MITEETITPEVEEKPNSVSIMAMQLILDKFFSYGELDKEESVKATIDIHKHNVSLKQRWSNFQKTLEGFRTNKKEITP